MGKAAIILFFLEKANRETAILHAPSKSNNDETVITARFGY